MLDQLGQNLADRLGMFDEVVPHDRAHLVRMGGQIVPDDRLGRRAAVLREALGGARTETRTAATNGNADRMTDLLSRVERAAAGPECGASRYREI